MVTGFDPGLGSSSSHNTRMWTNSETHNP